jgi:hypothetical protein
MILSSINIRGLGGAVKKSAIKELVTRERVEFLAIQETKFEVVTEDLCCSIWGGDNCQWAYLPSSGNSGGILSIWNKASATLIFSFIGEGFVGVCVEWGPNRKVCFIVNIYSSCDIVAKRRLWRNLIMSKGGFGGSVWCLLGDFNAVLNRVERRGVNQITTNLLSAEIAEFRDFVNDMELIDLPVLGRQFTWAHPNGVSMSRIDRVLMSEEWITLGNNSALWVLPRSVSDHCPLMVRSSSSGWGPRPFRFKNFWLSNKAFNGVVKNYWRSSNVTGWMAYVLTEKLKGQKAIIRNWDREVYGGMDAKIEISVLDLQAELVGLSEGEVIRRKSLFSEMWHLKISNASLTAQRSRSRWLKEGDTNSRYFHAVSNLE